MLKFVLLVIATALSYHHVNAQINMTEYLRMPPMMTLDDYDDCFLEVPPHKQATYCLVKSLIKPNESSEIWNIVEKYSKDGKHFYRHDRLIRGICMSWCKTLMNHYDYETREKYYLAKFFNDTEIYQDPNIHSDALVHRARYSRYATECVNHELRKKYGLMAQSELKYCITNQDKLQYRYDSLDYFFIWMCVALVGIISASTSYDFYLKRNNLPHLCNREHYKRPVKGGFTPILVSFSLPRNWYKLTSESSSNAELSRELRPINAIRVFCMMGVVCAHVALANNMSPQTNPYYMELKFFGLGNMILINGTSVLQSFFAITGFLTAVQFMDVREKNKFKMSFLWKAIIYRYFRFTPAYLFVLLFNATVLYKMQDGPMWPNWSDTERLFCRRHGWTNLLYINNFIDAREPVMYSWYLAADFQLTVIGSVLHMIIWKFSKFTKFVFTIALIIAFIIPAVLTYQHKFEGAFMATPEITRYAHWFSEQYHVIYIPFYGNLASSLLGMIGGMIYYRHKQGHIDLKKSRWLAIFWYSMIPIAFLGFLSGYIFYVNNYERPAIWIAVYASLMKSLWGIFGATLVVGTALNTGRIFKNIMRMPIFRTMGRLTFGAYLIHPSVLRVLFGSIRQPLYSDDDRIYHSTLSVYVTSYLLSFIICLTVEMPCSVIQKWIFSRDTNHTDKTIYETTEPETIKLSKNINNLDNVNSKTFS